MPRFTPIYGAFVARLDEVNLLRSKAAALGRTKNAVRHGAEISALCRGSVVLLSSHIEAFIKELGEHTLDSIYYSQVCRSNISISFFYYMSREIIDNIKSVHSAEKLAENMRRFVNNESEMWENYGGFPRPISAVEFNTGFSNPKFDKVKKYLGRFGYHNFRQDFFRELGRNAQLTINALDQIVDTRNSIAHGDPAATKTPHELKDMIESARLFCRTTDSIFAKWCGENICNIRRG